MMDNPIQSIMYIISFNNKTKIIHAMFGLTLKGYGSIFYMRNIRDVDQQKIL